MNKYEITVATFDKLAEQYQQKYMDFDFYSETFDIFCHLVSEVSAEILDIACGPGNISRYLLNKRPDYRIRGIDLAPNMVTLARKNNPTASFEVMDSRDISTIDKTFDAILCGFCTPYLSKADVEKLILAMRGRLNLGGILYLSTMEDEDRRSGFQSSTAEDKIYVFYHQFTHLEQALRAAGFEILKVLRKQFPAEGAEPTTDLFIYAKAI